MKVRSHSAETSCTIPERCGPIPSCVKLWQELQSRLNIDRPAVTAAESVAISFAVSCREEHASSDRLPIAIAKTPRTNEPKRNTLTRRLLLRRTFNYS